MKYSLQNEMLATASYHAESHVAQDEYLHGMLQTAVRQVAKAFSIAFRPFTRFLMILERHYSSNEFLDNDQEELERYERSYKRRVPHRLWDRHSALLYETDRCSRKLSMETCDAGCTESEIATCTHINVEKIHALPVWSSNLDEVGIITRQV